MPRTFCSMHALEIETIAMHCRCYGGGAYRHAFGGLRMAQPLDKRQWCVMDLSWVGDHPEQHLRRREQHLDAVSSTWTP